MRLRQTIFQLGDDGVDAGLGFLGGVSVPGVVGADQDDGDLGMKSVDFAMIDPPQNVRSGVAAESEIERLAWFVELLPGGKEIFIRRPGLVVVVGDGVANHQELCVRMVLDGIENRFVTFGPPRLIEAIRRGRGVVGAVSEGHRGTKNDERECGCRNCKKGKEVWRGAARVFHAAILCPLLRDERVGANSMGHQCSTPCC